jgi:hypothetical protein
VEPNIVEMLGSLILSILGKFAGLAFVLPKPNSHHSLDHENSDDGGASHARHEK